MSSNLITVIMYIFKENENEIVKSLHSALGNPDVDQIIVILDNPNNIIHKLIFGSFKNPKIQIIENRKKMGYSTSMKKAMEQATGKMILRIKPGETFSVDNLSITNGVLAERNIYEQSNELKYFC